MSKVDESLSLYILKRRLTTDYKKVEMLLTFNGDHSVIYHTGGFVNRKKMF